MELTINKLKAALQKPLPGIAAQYAMAPLSRPKFDLENLTPDQYRPSAVLVVFCLDENDKLFIPLIERIAYKGVHSAQVSFPGGKYEKEDGDLQNTALRECFEEIGLRDGIEVIGKLTRLFIPVSSFLVEPYIAFCSIKNPILVPQQREVKSTLRLYLDKLLNENTVEQGIVQAADYQLKTPYFLVEGFKVWGATAMILSELKTILSR